MKTIFTIIVILFTAVSIVLGNFHPNEIKTDNSIKFIENKGQLADRNGIILKDILYYTKNIDGCRLYISGNKLSYIISKTEIDNDKNNPLKKIYGLQNVLQQKKVESNKSDYKKVKTTNIKESVEQKNLKTINYRLDMDFLGANANPTIITYEECYEQYNFYYANCPSGINGVKAFKKIVIKNIYDNIDAVYYSNSDGLKYDFILNPGANANQIKIKFNGAHKVYFDENGSLNVTTPLGSINTSLKYYSGLNNSLGQKISEFDIIKIENNIIYFQNIIKSKKQEVLSIGEVKWSRYFGGNKNEGINGIVVDAENNIIIAGYTYSDRNFPVDNADWPALQGEWDAFVTKFDQNGKIIWSTYYGGTGEESAFSLKVDNQNKIVVCGNTTSTNFPKTKSGAGANQYDQDIFVLKLTSEGINHNNNDSWCVVFNGSLFYSNTYYAHCLAYDISFDPFRNVYIVGYLYFHDNDYWYNWYGIVWKLSEYGTSTTDGFFIEGIDGSIAPYGISVDKESDVLIVGQSKAANWSDAYNFNLQGNSDGFMMKINSDLTSFEWIDRVGTNYSDDDRSDYLTKIEADYDNNYITIGTMADGSIGTKSCNLNYRGKQDVFVMKTGPDGLDGGPGVRWRGYLGGNKTETGWGLSLDNNRNIYIVGNTESTDYPTSNNAYQNENAGGYDAFVSLINRDGGMLYSSFYGGNGDETAYCISSDNKTDFIIAGVTTGTLKDANNERQPADECFVAKFFSVTDVNDNSLSDGIYNISPNPVRNMANISFNVITPSNIKIVIYNSLGMKVMTIDDKFYSEGNHSIDYDLSFLNPGLYFCNIQGKEWYESQKIIIGD